MMNRRTWLARAGAMAATGVVLRAGRSGAQETADPLRMPGAVQQRTVVSEGQNDETVTAIEHRLKCTCGCNLDIFTCRTTDFSCGVSPGLHDEVVALLAAGNTPDQVVASFVAKYGEEVLMAPKPEGFNLAGYLVPGLLLTVAAAALAAVLLRRHRVGAMAAAEGASTTPAAVPGGASPGELARLEQALMDVDR